MGRPQQYLCKNRDGNCPNYRDTAVVTVGGTEKFVCPLGLANCERDNLEPIKPPEPPIVKFLKRFAIIAVPVLCAGLVWLYFATRPPPPYILHITYTSPPAARVHPGGPISWTFSVEGGKLSDKLNISVDSLSPSLLSKTDVLVETVDNINRKYKLTARPIAGQTGNAEIKVTLDVAAHVKATTNLAFDVVTLGPPTLTLQSTPPLVLESGHDTLVLNFTVSDEEIDSDKITFSATADPADKVTSGIQVNGGSRTVTLSRNQHESGPVSLSVRVVTPDGRETNQTYDVSVAALPAPPPPPVVCIKCLLKDARDLWLKQQYQGAIGKCEQVIAQDPRSVEAWTIKGTSLFSLKQYQDALASCKTALGFDPQHLEALFIRAASEEQLKMNCEALQSYKKYLLLASPGDPLRPQMDSKVQVLSRLCPE
jgi:hypothetical protein